MKKVLVALLVFIAFAAHIHADHPARHVKKVILWGHKLHSHTHSYIHWGFKRAFEHLGYETHWLDAHDNITHFDFANSLFITEGQVDQNIPVRDDCYYVIHNCKPDKYQHLLANGHAVILQVYTHDCLDRKEPALSFCFHYDISQPIIYMPWATDLLPHEIDTIKAKIGTRKAKRPVATFVGSISHGSFGNQNEVNAFKRACQEHGIQFEHGGVNKRSMEENIELMQTAQLAPSLQGAWQCKQGYIPCRIFKNISYGAIPITNAKTVYELFDKKIIYHPDSYQLGLESIKRLQTWSLNDQYKWMDLVKEKHTYLNRIESLFQFFEMVEDHKSNQG